MGGNLEGVLGGRGEEDWMVLCFSYFEVRGGGEVLWMRRDGWGGF